MKKTTLAILAALLLTIVSGCAATKPRIAPPPFRVEVLTIRPGLHHVWVAGYWKWSSVNYIWVEGRWVKVKPNRAWIPGDWRLVGSYWARTPGRWENIKKKK